MAAILDFCGKWKTVNISKTVRDRAISSVFLTHRLVQESPVQRREISIFATFGGHLGFLWKMKKCQYLENRKSRAISSEFLTRRVVQESPVQRGENFNFRHFRRPSWIFAENEKVSISRKP